MEGTGSPPLACLRPHAPTRPATIRSKGEAFLGVQGPTLSDAAYALSQPTLSQAMRLPESLWPKVKCARSKRAGKAPCWSPTVATRSSVCPSD